MKSYVNSIWPAAGCLLAIEDALSKKFNWNSIRAPLGDLFGLVDNEAGQKQIRSLLASGELLSIAAEDFRTINSFLQEFGSAQQLAPWKPFSTSAGGEPEYRVGTASRLHAETSWDGAESFLVGRDGRQYKAFQLPGQIERVHKLYNIGPDYLIRLWGSAFDVSIDLRGVSCVGDVEEVDVIAPCVSVVCDNDMSWLVGADGTFEGPVRTLSGTMFGAPGMNKIKIEQAVQTSKFEMDAKGAAVHAVAAIQFCLGTGCMPQSKRLIIVDRPFWVWATRGELCEPLMYGFLAEDTWLRIEKPVAESNVGR